MTTSFYYQRWPNWFCEKYAEDIYFNEWKSGSLSLSHEKALSGLLRELECDVQKAVDWSCQTTPFVVVYLHECGAVSRVVITPTSIAYIDGEPYSHNQSCDPHFGWLKQITCRRPP